MVRKMLVAAALFAMGGVAFAQSEVAHPPVAEPGETAAPATIPMPPQNPVETQTKSEGEEMVCRRVVNTGSNMPRRVCRSRAQWRADADAARTALESNRRARKPCDTTSC